MGRPSRSFERSLPDNSSNSETELLGAASQRSARGDRPGEGNHTAGEKGSERPLHLASIGSHFKSEGAPGPCKSGPCRNSQKPEGAPRLKPRGGRGPVEPRQSRREEGGARQKKGRRSDLPTSQYSKIGLHQQWERKQVPQREFRR